ncbi:3-oxoacid CoA-transferase subunit A [Sphingobium ummariense]
MIDKICAAADALRDVADGATILIGGFGEAGSPTELIHALIDQGASGLTVVTNNAGNGEIGLARLIQRGRVRKLICSYPRSAHGYVFDGLYRQGRIELELVPQGTLAERIRAGGAGIPAFFTPTAAGTDLAQGKESRMFNGRPHILEQAIRADVALIKAEAGDRWGNLIYRKAARNFGPAMATAADLTVAQVCRVEPLGAIDPEAIVTPSIFVQKVVHIPDPISERAHIKELAAGQRT